MHWLLKLQIIYVLAGIRMGQEMRLSSKISGFEFGRKYLKSFTGVFYHIDAIVASLYYFSFLCYTY